MATVSDKPWSDYTQADYSDEQWAKACLIDKGEGEGKQRYALPVYEPDGALNRAACHNAAARINQVDAPDSAKAAAAKKLAVLYRDELDEEPPDGLMKMAGVSMDMANRESQVGPIEFRDAKLDDVNYAKRIITVIAVPYRSSGLIEYRGSIWHEIFERNAFAGAEGSPHRVRVNRGHDRNRTVGKVLSFPQGVSDEGLVAECRIAKTPLGDETLALADEECLSASVGYGVVDDGQKLDKLHKTRLITKAFLDHLAFVESPTYADARVISVHHSTLEPEALQPLVTPNLDSAISEMRAILEWSSARLKRQ
jgi:phage head maturation protease